MDESKDYYEILGVHPSAELRVIRAAYKAMAQYYHPDKAENKKEATKIMADINEAYEVLSDTNKRREYDALHGNKSQADDSVFSDADDAHEGYSSSKDWSDVVNIYPELKCCQEKLRKISWALAEDYCAYLLNTKEYRRGEQIAADMAGEYLQRYFGSDRLIIELAQHLINLGHKRAAKMLNEQVQVFGSRPDRRAVEGIIRKIRKDFDIADQWWLNSPRPLHSVELSKKENFRGFLFVTLVVFFLFLYVLRIF